LHRIVTAKHTILSKQIYVKSITIKKDILTEFDSEAILQNTDDIVVLAPKDIYKIFSLTNFYVIY
jgi:hypothetical protein